MSNNGYKKKQGAGAGRVQFLGLRPTTLENKYIVGSGVTTQSRFVQNALRNRASNNSQQKPCCFPGPPPPLPVQVPPCQWSQQGCIGCIENDPYAFGASVALSDDGNTAVVGLPFYLGPGYPAGAIRLYKITNGIWTQTSEIPGTIAPNNSAKLGDVVAISGDGSTVIASEPALDTFSQSQFEVREGVVKIFSVDSAGNLTPFPNAGSPTILGDAAQVAVRPFQGYVLPTAPSNSNVFYKNFGGSIAINYDGTVIAASSTMFPYQEQLTTSATRSGGGVQIYEKNAGIYAPAMWYMAPLAWSGEGSTSVGGSGATVFGRSLSLSKDGTTLAIGAPRYQENPTPHNTISPANRPYQSGSVVVVNKTGGVWPTGILPAVGTQGYIIPENAAMPTPSWQLIQLSSPYERERFGGSVAINGDGTRIVTASHPWLCSSCEATPITRVWDFDAAQNTWNQVGQDIPAVTTITTATRITCAINESGSRILVGDKNSSGATCYELIGNTWTVVCYPIARANVIAIDMDAGGSRVALGTPSPISQLENGSVGFYELLNA